MRGISLAFILVPKENFTIMKRLYSVLREEAQVSVSGLALSFAGGCVAAILVWHYIL